MLSVILTDGNSSNILWATTFVSFEATKIIVGRVFSLDDEDTGMLLTSVTDADDIMATVSRAVLKSCKIEIRSRHLRSSLSKLLWKFQKTPSETFFPLD